MESSDSEDIEDIDSIENDDVKAVSPKIVVPLFVLLFTFFIILSMALAKRKK